MLTLQDVKLVIGGMAYDKAGAKVGRIGMIYVDDETGRPDWVSVNTGFFGTTESFVPLAGAQVDGEDLRLAHSRDVIKDAPTVDTDEHLSPEQEDELYRHYELTRGAALAPDAQPSQRDAQPRQHDAQASQHDAQPSRDESAAT